MLIKGYNMVSFREYLNEELSTKAITGPKLVVGKTYVVKDKWSEKQPLKFIGYKILTYAENTEVKGWLDNKLYSTFKDIMKSYDVKKPKELAAKLLSTNGEVQDNPSQVSNIAVIAITDKYSQSGQDSFNILTKMHAYDGKWESGQKIFEDI